MNGLSPEDHGKLNSWKWQWAATEADWQRVREEYEGDSKAQRQIDVYGGSERYHQKFAEYRDALRAGNSRKAARLERWFKKHGY